MSGIKQGGFLISKIHQLAGRIFSKKLKNYNINEINPAQGRILFVLWQNDGITIQELAKKTSLGKSTLTRMLDRMEEAGHLTRVYPREDRRKVLIELTEANRKMKKAYEDVSEDMLHLFYKGFSEEEVDLFETFLNRIFHNLSEEENNQ
ncbi:MAG: MarR family transcriptional regulator [Clostridia bacterium]|nr:MarR family transcriptional regulator [Clostridia bacterium]